MVLKISTSSFSLRRYSQSKKQLRSAEDQKGGDRCPAEHSHDAQCLHAQLLNSSAKKQTIQLCAPKKGCITEETNRKQAPCTSNSMNSYCTNRIIQERVVD